MKLDFDKYHKFMQDNVLSQMDITYDNLIERGLAFNVPEP